MEVQAGEKGGGTHRAVEAGREKERPWEDAPTIPGRRGGAPDVPACSESETKARRRGNRPRECLTFVHPPLALQLYPSTNWTLAKADEQYLTNLPLQMPPNCYFGGQIYE